MQVNKRILRWRPFWNKVYRNNPSENEIRRITQAQRKSAEHSRILCLRLALYLCRRRRFHIKIRIIVFVFVREVASLVKTRLYGHEKAMLIHDVARGKINTHFVSH